jgi:cysteine desulfurase
MNQSARVYLDHNATSPLRPEAQEAMRRAMDPSVANPSSLHAEGRAARALLERAREQIAALACVSSKEIVFTSGGTEAVAAAVRGVCDRAPERLRRVVVSAVEHSAVLATAKLAGDRGFKVVKVPCDDQGRVDHGAFIECLQPGTALACLQWANNETGVVQPVEEVGQACRQAGVPFLVDAVQAAGKVELDLWGVHADLAALSAHKLGGPQGAGALVVRDGIVLTPLIPGGAQEKRRRAGTPSVAALAGFGAAAEAAQERLKQESDRLQRLRAKLETRLRRMFPAARFHGQAVPRLTNTLNFAVPDVSGEVLVIALDLAGVSVSTGSACASGAVEPSHVMQAMGFDEIEARGAVRVSLGWSTTQTDVDRFLDLLPDIVTRIRKGQSPPTRGRGAC